MTRRRSLGDRLRPRSALGQMTIIVCVSIVAVIVSGRVLEAIRKSELLRLADVDVVTERVTNLLELMHAAPPDQRADLVSWANAVEPKVTLVRSAEVAEIVERSTEEGTFRRLVHDFFPQDQPFPEGSRLVSDGGRWTLIVPIDAGSSLVVAGVPNQILTNDVLGPVSYYVIALVVFLILLRSYSRRTFLGPLARISEAAKRANGLEGESFEIERGSLEIQTLTQALNDMRDRVRELIEARTRMLRSVSHDLRTPLTRLRQRVERLDEGELQTKMLSDIRHIDALVEETLDYLRSDASEEVKERIDVASLLQTIQADFADMGADVVYEGPDRIVALAKPNALRRAVTNLCDNALRFGSHARIDLCGADEAIRIVVSDDGPGIPEDMRSLVVKPFFKVDAARPVEEADTHAGTALRLGLGLSIVSEIVAAHGGTLRLGDNEPHGLSAQIELPRSEEG
ncbi:ATP-binding protein [Acuticoccus mangrovi]|uniref:histidine kinase n=1 Tax=Acuticoccus mangrovi TaxID=2796142 RepID=A0A934INX3_9HYPH|nr:ATP-binding protein [Acuticoccus mangrovi]MBJ3775657.1 HAMP domain-containing protein [Acuticoccus mangrovi]